jgi:tetratricopeptide (TPR) repeat protein
VGKTELALAWAQQARDRFADGQLYADLGGFGEARPVDPSEVLGMFLRSLGVSPRRIPIVLAEQVALYRSVTVDRSLLVLLDNAYSVAQVRVLLPSSSASMTVVTSRGRLAGLVADGARLVDVGTLSVDDSVVLLGRAVGQGRISRARGQAEQLAGLCGGLPLALCVAAARLAARPLLSVERFTSELADEADRLGVLSGPESPSVRAAFDVSYRSLDADAAALYRRLAWHPGPDFGPGPVAALTRTAGVITRLLDASLLQEIREDRFRFHDLVRLHARQKAETGDTREGMRRAIRAMLEWYLAAARRADAIVTPYRRRPPYMPETEPCHLPDPSGRAGALEWLERERVNLIAAGRAAWDHGHAELAWQLADVLWPLFLYHKHYSDRLDVDSRGVEAAREWGNSWAEAVMLKRLGRTYTIAGDYELAERHTRAAVARYQESGDVRGELDAREGLAQLYRDSGRREQAALIFADVLAANRALGTDRHTGLTLINLATVLTTLDRPGEAVGLLEEAQTIFADLSEIDPYNEVRVVIGLAGAYLGVGDLAGAERAAAQAAGRMHDLGSDYERAEAEHLLGQIAARRGDDRAAHRHYRFAVDLFDGLGSPRGAALRRQVPDLGGTADARQSPHRASPPVGSDANQPTA